MVLLLVRAAQSSARVNATAAGCRLTWLGASGEAHIILRRELSAQNGDTEAEIFDQRLREREARRKAAAARPFFDIEPTRQYERES